MGEDKIFLDYGGLSIDQQEFLTSAANELESYIQNLPWSKKRKDLFRLAYSDIMSHTVTGATNQSGLWEIRHGGDKIDLDSKSKKDREMYGEAAYFIQLLMKKAASKVEKKEETKPELKLFDNKFLKDSFHSYIGMNEFGGQSWNTADHWNSLDNDGELTERKKTLIRMLQNWGDLLNSQDYNFEGTAYTDFNDFNNRRLAAIQALQNNNTNTISRDEITALNRLGLNYKDYFYVPEQTLTTDIQTTQEGSETKSPASTLRIQKTNWRTNPISYLTLQLRYGNNSNGMISKLQDYYSRGVGSLSDDETGELRAIYQHLALSSISNDEFNTLKRFTSLKDTRLLDWRKIDEVDGLYFNKSLQQVIQLYDKNNFNPTRQFFTTLTLNDASTEKSPRQLSEGLQYEDYARIGAALGDIVSLGGFGANVVGSIVSLFGDTTADIADDSVSTWEAFKNFGKNLGWTAAGFIPGAKLGKVAKNILRWAPKLMVVLNDYNLLTDESNKNTWNKLTTESRLLKEGLTDEDLRNITYWIRAITGTTNAARATTRDIKYSKARGTLGLKFRTKSGEEIELTNKEVDEINAAGARKGLKAAEDKFKEISKQRTGTEHELLEGQIKFSENGRRGMFKDSRSKVQDMRLLGERVIFRTPEQQQYYNYLQRDRELGGYAGWRPFWQRGTSSYFDHFDSGSFRNPFNGMLQRIDPYRNMPTSQTSTPTTPTRIENPVSPLRPVNPEQGQLLDIRHGIVTNDRQVVSDPYRGKAKPSKKLRALDKKIFNDIINKGRFSNNVPEEGSFTFTDPVGNTRTIEVQLRDNDYLITSRSSDGTMDIRSVSIDDFKSNMREMIKNIINSHKPVSNISETARILRKFLNKNFGWLKQGGTIDTTISNFLKNLK